QRVAAALGIAAARAIERVGRAVDRLRLGEGGRRVVEVQAVRRGLFAHRRRAYLTRPLSRSQAAATSRGSLRSTPTALFRPVSSSVVSFALTALTVVLKSAGALLR